MIYGDCIMWAVDKAVRVIYFLPTIIPTITIVYTRVDNPVLRSCGKNCTFLSF